MRMVLQRNMVDQINKIRVKKNMVENLTEVVGIILEKNLTEVDEIILEKNLTGVEEIILEEDLTEVEEIILEEDLTGVEENQPTKMVVGEVTRIILLINLEIRAIETVIENHHIKDSSI